MLKAMSRVFFVTAGIVAASLAGCASAGLPAAREPTSAFVDVDHVLFDNGIDFVENPEALTGNWRADVERELQQRIERSDIVGLIKVETLVVERDPEGAKKLVLSTAVADVWKGQLDEEQALVVGPAQAGYGALERAQTRVLEGQYVLFLKWAEDESGRVSGRFHLSPSSEAVVSAVKRALGKDGSHVIRITR